MNDSVKNFIRQHRHAFDAALPGAHGWRNVEKALARLRSADPIEATLVHNRVLLDTAEPSARVWERIAASLDSGRTLDPLEDFIRVNREAFDVAQPDRLVWEALVGTLPPAAERTRPETRIIPMGGAGAWGKPLLRAAAAIALLVTGIGLGLWWASIGRDSGMEMAEVSNEYAELEQFYQRDIASKQARLASFAGNQPEEVNLDLQQLDLIMNELRLELADVPPGNREQVVRAMIDNYKTKTSILQRVLERLEQSNTGTPSQSETNHEVEKI